MRQTKQLVVFPPQLVALGLDYHFDDGAVDCLHGSEDENGFPLLTLEEAVIVDIKVADCYDCFAASGADLSVDCPIGHSLKAQGL